MADVQTGDTPTTTLTQTGDTPTTTDDRKINKNTTTRSGNSRD